MALTGAHVLLYTPEPEALRATLRDVFGWRHVDAGDGWLIFSLPAAELGVHPSDAETHHELSLREKGIEVRGEPEDKGFGIGVTVVLPGGVEVLLYEPRHPTAIDV
jgi:catechol 2,3-dioxygenase-like lactoylglutathione lyase family enzyme